MGQPFGPPDGDWCAGPPPPHHIGASPPRRGAFFLADGTCRRHWRRHLATAHGLVAATRDGRSDVRMPALLSRLRRSETVQATIPPRLSSHALGNAGLSPLETDFTGVSRNLAGVPQLIAMHTARAIRDPAVTKPEGIAFWLACGEEKVHCLVTRAALIFLAGCFLLERDYEKVF